MAELDALRADLRDLENKFDRDHEQMVQLWAWYQRNLARGEKVPGWIIAAVSIGIPTVATVLGWWLMARFPGLMGP